MPGAIFGGGSDNVPSNINVTTTQKIPEFMEKGAKETFEKAKPLADRPYPGFDTADRIAGFTPEHFEAFDLAKGNVGSYSPYVQQAGADYARARPEVNQTDIDRYMNPYIGDVVDSTVAELNRQHRRQSIQRHEGMTKAGTFLNEENRRAGDIQAEDNLNRLIAETVAKLQMGGFDKAMAQANTEKGRAIDLGGREAALGVTEQSAGQTDVTNLAAIADALQGQEQLTKDFDYKKFIENYFHPQQQYTWLMSLLSGAPHSTTTTETGFRTQPVGTSNPWGQALGFGLQAASLFKSARKFKESGTPIDETDILKKVANLSVEKWRYRGVDVDHIGPYAEDFQEIFGVGDGVTISAVDAVGVLLASVKALAGEVASLRQQLENKENENA